MCDAKENVKRALLPFHLFLVRIFTLLNWLACRLPVHVFLTNYGNFPRIVLLLHQIVESLSSMFLAQTILFAQTFLCWSASIVPISFQWVLRCRIHPSETSHHDKNQKHTFSNVLWTPFQTFLNFLSGLFRSFYDSVPNPTKWFSFCCPCFSFVWFLCCPFLILFSPSPPPIYFTSSLLGPTISPTNLSPAHFPQIEYRLMCSSPLL